MSLSEISAALAALAAANCRRDSSCGLWLTADGNVLSSDPIEAARLLRHSLIRDAVKRQQESGRCFTR